MKFQQIGWLYGAEVADLCSQGEQVAGMGRVPVPAVTNAGPWVGPVAAAELLWALSREASRSLARVESLVSALSRRKFLETTPYDAEV